MLRQTGDLRREHLEAIDYVLRHTVIRLLVRAAGEEELEAAHEELRRLVPIALEPKLAAWVPRWRGLADLLEARLAVLSARDVESARRMAHAAEILALVASKPGWTQTKICDRLKLGAANLSRILGILEAHELVERRSVGRERRVHLGRLAGLFSEKAVQPSAGEAEVQRGVTYFFAAA